MAEKSLSERMQKLLDTNEDYAKLSTEVKATERNIGLLAEQELQYKEKIEANKISLKKYEADVQTAEPEKLPELKEKMDRCSHQILADENWLKLSHKNRTDAEREALKGLQEEKKRLFYTIIGSLGESGKKKVVDGLKIAVGQNRVWCDAVSKAEAANNIQPDSFLSPNARNLGLDFNDPQLGRFEFVILIRRYGNG